MDEYDKFLQSILLDSEGLSLQIMSLSSLYHMGMAALFGFGILMVYVLLSNREARDKNLFMVIPVTSILIAVILRIQGAEPLLFLGIFGILSMVRFRSELTDQRGITYILFAVIMGVISGVGNFLLALSAFGVVTLAILVSSRFLKQRLHYRMVVSFREDLQTGRQKVEELLKAKGFRFRHLAFSSDQGVSKTGEWVAKIKLEYDLSLSSLEQLEGAHQGLTHELAEWGCELELKSSGEGG